MQLNTFYRKESVHTTCAIDAECTSSRTDAAHILWGCESAQRFWVRMIGHWTGQSAHPAQLRQFKDAIATQTAPVISDALQQEMSKKFGILLYDYEEQMKRLW